MLLRSSFRQSFRAPVRMIACFVLMVLVCAFLTVGLDLRASTRANLEKIYDSFEVIAVPDFQAYLDDRGQRVKPGEHEGYWPCAAEDYDLAPIRAAYGVRSIDIRGCYGAVVGSTDFCRGFVKAGRYLDVRDVVRFVYQGTEPVTLPARAASAALPLAVTWSAAGYGTGNYASRLSLENPRTGIWTLEPGVEYIATVRGGQGTQTGQRREGTKLSNLILETGEYFRTVRPSYSEGAQWEDWSSEPYAPLAVYDENFWSTPQGKQFALEAASAGYNLRSVNAVTTGDLGAALPFYQGFLSVVEGHAFSQEDYDSGAKVCLVSRYLAGLNHWALGDRVELSFYSSEYLFSRKNTDRIPRYAAPTEDFFDQGSYEIVGFYDGRVTTDLNGVSSTQYTEDQGALWIDIYIPQGSVRNAPAPKLSQYNTTIRLDPLAGQQFLAEMADSGLMKAQNDGYELGLTLYDQGLSSAADGLLQMESISRLTVILSAAVAGLAVVVLAVSHVWRSRREIAGLRSLGLRRGQTLVVTLAGLLAICALGCALGAAAGHELSGWAAQKILAAAAEDTGDLSFTASLADTALPSLRETFAFRQVRQVRAALGASAGVWAFMLALGSALVWNESRKPPLLQLGRKE